MSKIKIENFGPIIDSGWIDISKVTVFIGNQGTGKSTIAKLISTLTWIEKDIYRANAYGEETKVIEKVKKSNLKYYLEYHRIENYVTESTGIFYIGNAYTIDYEYGKFAIKKSNTKYYYPQIIYIPAERNFISYVNNPGDSKFIPRGLVDFVTDFNLAKENTKYPLNLPVNKAKIYYSKSDESLHLSENKRYKIKLTESSSGFQAIAPLYLVSEFLADKVKTSENKMDSSEQTQFRKRIGEIYNNSSLTEEQRRVALSELTTALNKKAFINIVEEPELNLYPSSQWSLLQSLLKFNNYSDDNKLIITTHSPYIVNYLTLAIQADYLKEKIGNSKRRLNILKDIVALESTVSNTNVSIYQLNDKVQKLESLNIKNKIPTDKNFLNEEISQGNELFDKLLEIEDSL
jgi:predicted ATPase